MTQGASSATGSAVARRLAASAATIRRTAWALAAVVTAVVVALLARQNSELADLLGAVPAQVRAIPPWTVPLAGALKLGEVALNALAWRTALRAAAPARPADYGRVVAALQTGSALTALVPPKFATVGLLAIYRAAL
ncbi:MAG: hypothetical protein IT337_12855, partial [Thermomicrobiales bacterium]|nr:hypothetical protein [Thermomicrobiales bacterium]